MNPLDNPKDEVWNKENNIENEFNEPNEERNDWPGDLPVNLPKECMEPQYKSEEKFHHHVWNPDNEPNNLDNKFNDQVDW